MLNWLFCLLARRTESEACTVLTHCHSKLEVASFPACGIVLLLEVDTSCMFQGNVE